MKIKYSLFEYSSFEIKLEFI